jgi:hypothetical protein
VVCAVLKLPSCAFLPPVARTTGTAACLRSMTAGVRVGLCTGGGAEAANLVSAVLESQSEYFRCVVCFAPTHDDGKLLCDCRTCPDMHAVLWTFMRSSANLMRLKALILSGSPVNGPDSQLPSACSADGFTAGTGQHPCLSCRGSGRWPWLKLNTLLFMLRSGNRWARSRRPAPAPPPAR